MKHFLLTRWNLPGCVHHASLERVVDRRWQARRRELFSRYCLPSVARQSLREFTWLFLVYRGITTGDDLRWLQAQDERLRVVFVEDDASTGAPEAREAVRRLAPDDSWAITTRLDSDDILHPDHLRRVRVDHDGRRTIVEFSEGFYYDVLRDELRFVEERRNAFVSVLEPLEDLRTAWGWSHDQIAEDEIHYLEEPGWIALVHDQNTTTYLWGDPVAAARKRAVLAEFGVSRPAYLATRVRRLEWYGGRVRRRAGRELRRLRRAAATRS